MTRTKKRQKSYLHELDIDGIVKVLKSQWELVRVGILENRTIHGLNPLTNCEIRATVQNYLPDDWNELDFDVREIALNKAFPTSIKMA